LLLIALGDVPARRAYWPSAGAKGWAWLACGPRCPHPRPLRYGAVVAPKDTADGTDSQRSRQAPDPFATVLVDHGLGGAAYGPFLEVFRTLQDRVAAANAPTSAWEDLTGELSNLIDRLEPFAAGEHEQPAGTRLDLPGRGHPFLLPFVPEESTDTQVTGRVVFRRFHLGGNGAAHGGAVPLLFDEILGRLSNARGGRVARTAYLTVNYRQITPIGVELRLEATVDREEGRKRWVIGRLYDGDTVVADAEGLFVVLQPGQP
jgi:acyl-coenzyme A thioesterase PaaI-like protein